MTDRITLTEDEDTVLHLASIRGTTSEMTFARAELKEALESILYARVAQAKAEALRDAAARIYNGAGDPEQAFYNYGLHPWLTNLANTYDPKSGDNE